MKRVLLTSIAIAAVAAFGAAPAAAQHASLSIGGGGMKPSGDYATVDNMGWELMGAVEVSIPASPFAVRVDGMYGETSHQGSTLLTGSTKLSGGSVSAVYRIGAPAVPVRAYLLAGAGYYRADIEGTSQSKPGLGGGAGVSLGIGPMKVFGEARYMTVLTSGSSLNFFPISVGLTFGL
jgi:hypothetical protein